MMNDSLADFRDAIRATGLEPPDIIVPGKLHRFPGVGKRNGNTAGWCKFFDDCLGGCFGDWSSDLSENWQAKRNKPITRIERKAFTQRVKDAKKMAMTERLTKQAKAAKRANAIWNTAIPAHGNHPYLVRKHIKPNGARIHKGSLVLPVLDINGNLTSLQFIGSDGRKMLLSGGRKHNCFIPVEENMETPSCVIICEGWATGCTLKEDEPTAMVLAAIDAGNLVSVALIARQCWPLAELVIAGDDDRLTDGNPGATKAKAAAVAAGAQLALPQWPEKAPQHLSDFNDLVVWLAGGAI